MNLRSVHAQSMVARPSLGSSSSTSRFNLLGFDRVAAEAVLRATDQLLLPRDDLPGMHIELRRQLGWGIPLISRTHQEGSKMVPEVWHAQKKTFY